MGEGALAPFRWYQSVDNAQGRLVVPNLQQQLQRTDTGIERRHLAGVVVFLLLLALVARTVGVCIIVCILGHTRWPFLGKPQRHAARHALGSLLRPLLAQPHRRQRLVHLWVGRIPPLRLGQVRLAPLLGIVFEAG